MIICEYCGARVYSDTCEYCDMPVKNPAPPKIIYPEKPPVKKRRRKLKRKAVAGTVAVLALGVAIINIAVNLSPERTYDYAIEYDEEIPVYDDGVYTAGIYKIGVDIPEGTYLFISGFSDGYGEEGVYSDSYCQEKISWEDTEFSGSRIAKLSGDGYVDFSYALAYNIDMHPEIMNDPYERDGMFLVGRDIPAGTYTLSSYEEDAGWYLYSGLCTYGAVLEDYGYDDEITLEDGEIFQLKDCVIDNS